MAAVLFSAAVGLAHFASPAISNASADTQAPTLTGFAVSIAGQTVGPGTVIRATYTTDEPVSPIYFGFTDSVGHQYQFATPDGVGTVTGTVPSTWANGLVHLGYVDMDDAAGNRTTYFPGSVAHYPSGTTGPTTNPFNLNDGNFTVARTPGSPPNIQATPEDGAAIVSWESPTDDGGAAIIAYAVTSSPGGETCTTGGAVSCTVSGLTNGTVYTFAVTATNAVATGPASRASDPVTPVAPPAAPTDVVATPWNTIAVVTWAPPGSNGGSPITGYAVTSSPGGKTCGTVGPLSCTFHGLTDGTPYSFTVTATNAQGSSPASVASDPVTPKAPPIGVPTMIASSVAGQSSCARLVDGTVRCWGRDDTYELGSGVPLQGVPLEVVGATDATSVATGASHACAIVDGGSIVCWGAASSGELGIGSMPLKARLRLRSRELRRRSWSWLERRTRALC